MSIMGFSPIGPKAAGYQRSKKDNQRFLRSFPVQGKEVKVEWEVETISHCFRINKISEKGVNKNE